MSKIAPLAAFQFLLRMHRVGSKSTDQREILRLLGETLFGPAPSLGLSRAKINDLFKPKKSESALTLQIGALEDWLKEVGGIPIKADRGIAFNIRKVGRRNTTYFLDWRVKDLPAWEQSNLVSDEHGRIYFDLNKSLKAYRVDQVALSRTFTFADATLVSIGTTNTPARIELFRHNEKTWIYPQQFKSEAKAYNEKKRIYWRRVIKRSPNKWWDGRLWGVVRGGLVGREYRLALVRVRYSDHKFISSKWNSPLSRTLEISRSRESFKSRLLEEASQRQEMCPPISPIRIGALLVLSNNKFVVASDGKRNPRFYLAGQGMACSINTPERWSTPKLSDQISRRFVEDIGLAIDDEQIGELGYIQDTSAQFANHWVLAAVTTTKSEDDLRQIYNDRRYRNFTKGISFVEPHVLFRACTENDFEHYDRILLLAVALYFTSKGAITLRSWTSSDP